MVAWYHFNKCPRRRLGIARASAPDRDLVRAFEELSHHDDPMVDAEDAADLLEAREADLDYIDQFIDPYDYDDNPYA